MFKVEQVWWWEVEVLGTVAANLRFGLWQSVPLALLPERPCTIP